ncbi:MAG TPA: VWA domain-containing protein [Alphaproteobacteria bacterium]|nr:VWA domain-containing protein [Alphaproteobacteria bacterium]
MGKDSGKLPDGAARTAGIAEFLAEVARTPAPRPAEGRGRLIFAMDATASREPTWDRACKIQGEMFKATEGLGGLDVQLVFYRGFGECKTSPWVSDAGALVRSMTAVFCLAGQTQIAKVLRHALVETKVRKVNALVFVGDCMEENVDELAQLGGVLGLLGVPCFMFHEGADPIAGRAFKEIARLSHGAYCAFDAASAQQLKDLLSAVAVYAAGGRKALAHYGKSKGGVVLQLTHQLG